MFFSSHNVNTINEQLLRQFLSAQIPEGHHLDYKSALSGKNRTKQHFEFLKDITAFANANGGDIIIGVLEPDEGQSIDNQIVGVEDGDKIAHSLENLAGSGVIDPPISGLIVQPIRLQSGRFVIIVHVPLSLGKPHLVNYDKKLGAFMRHSESILQMTSHDIRQAVLASATAEGRAKDYLQMMRKTMIDEFFGTNTGFILQGFPLIPPEQPIRVFTNDVIKALKSNERLSIHGELFSLMSMPRPKPTIDGIQGRDSRDDTQWISEIHRTGYIGVAYKLNDINATIIGKSNAFVIGDHFSHLFTSFGDLCDEILSIIGFDAPYAAYCELVKAKGSFFRLDSSRLSVSEPCQKENLLWPNRLRDPGESFNNIAKEWVTLLLHAYGFESTEDTQHPHGR